MVKYMNPESDREIIIEVRGDVKELIRRVGIQNGRIGDVEAKSNALEIKLAELLGERTGSRWTMGNIIAVVAAIGAILAVLFK